MRRVFFLLGIFLALSGNAVGQPSEHPAIFNVRNYGAKGDAATDDSVAIASAAAAVAANHRSATLYFPSGVYRYFPSGVYRLVAALPTFAAPVSVLGDGHAQSVILVDTAFSGEVFSWSGAQPVPSEEDSGDSRQLSDGPHVGINGIRIVGNRTTTHLQNAFVFYDRAGRVLMQDVDVFYMTGRALYSGVSQRTSQSYIARSEFYSLRFFNCGSAGVAVVDFNSHGDTGTNDVMVDALDIYAPYGTGVIIHSNGAPVHAIKFSKLRIEGLQNGTTSADLLQVGGAALSGNVNHIEFNQTDLIDPYFGLAAIRFAAPNLSSAPYEVRYEG
jgi:hypothetical protein